MLRPLQFWAVHMLVRCIRLGQGQVSLAEFFTETSVISQPFSGGSISVGTKQLLNGGAVQEINHLNIFLKLHFHQFDFLVTTSSGKKSLNQLNYYA